MGTSWKVWLDKVGLFVATRTLLGLVVVVVVIVVVVVFLAICLVASNVPPLCSPLSSDHLWASWWMSFEQIVEVKFAQNCGGEICSKLWRWNLLKMGQERESGGVWVRGDLACQEWNEGKQGKLFKSGKISVLCLLGHRMSTMLWRW